MQLETDERPGTKGTLKWRQDPLWSVECQFLEALPVTAYTPSGIQGCGENSIGFVWWEEDENGKMRDAISICLNHFLILYDGDGDREVAGMCGR